MITAFAFINFFWRSMWIIILSAITHFFIMTYCSPVVTINFSKKNIRILEKKITRTISFVKHEAIANDIIKGFKKLKMKIVD